MSKPLYSPEPDEQQEDLEQSSKEVSCRLQGLLANSGRKMLDNRNTGAESRVSQGSLSSSVAQAAKEKTMKTIKEGSVKQAVKNAVVAATQKVGSKAIIAIACILLVILLLVGGICAVIGIVDPSGKKHPAKNDMVTILSEIQAEYDAELLSIQETTGFDRIDLEAESCIPWTDILSVYYLYWLDNSENDDISWVSTAGRFRLEDICAAAKTVSRTPFEYTELVAVEQTEDATTDIDNTEDYEEVTKYGLKYVIEWLPREQIAERWGISGDDLEMILEIPDEQWQWVYEGLQELEKQE